MFQVQVAFANLEKNLLTVSSSRFQVSVNNLKRETKKNVKQNKPKL